MTPSAPAKKQDWAYKKIQRVGPPPKVSVAEFVSEANIRLRKDRAYLTGTRFVVDRSGSEDVEGSPSWEGPVEMRALVHRIVQDMILDFEVQVPFRIDN